ncbi:MAG: menaquinone biosynthetic enzyme MqnA/MqnD family protein [Vicinamibacterales bacterium]
MTPLQLGAVEFLNARPLVYGLDRDPRVSLRFDLPSRCADLLHAGQIDLGLIPSIEYLRAPGGPQAYRIVPDLAIASNGPVASVALYTTREMRDVRSVALDTSSRTSVALVRVVCAKLFRIEPRFEHRAPSLPAMLGDCDAALVIGDIALFQQGGPVDTGASGVKDVEKIDLGELWTHTTGLPFVYAFWAGPAGAAVDAEAVALLQQARRLGCDHTDGIAEAFFPGDPARQAVGDRYLRDNIKYSLGHEERAGLELFYRYAAETGVVAGAVPPRFYEPDSAPMPSSGHVTR